MLRSFFILLLFAVLLVPASPAPAQSLGEVTPRPGVVPTTIYVAPFNIDAGVAMDIEVLPRIIRRDLELSGFFIGPPKPREASVLYSRQTTQSIDFDGWKSIGVQHYVMGRVMMNEGRLRVRAILYDIDSRQLIFERFFENTRENERALAHRVSDEIVKFAKGVDGIAQTRLLYVTEQVPSVKEVALMDADGFNPRKLTSYGKLTAGPVWGANGTEFYFTSFHGNRGNIYGMQINSGSTWEIAAYGGTNHSPAWSPSLRRLAMVLSRDGNSEIYTSTRDGSGLNRLTETPLTEGSPTWSPDGSKVVFVSNTEGGVHLFLMNADGSGRRRLTTRGSWNDAPSWSPDGSRIAFVSRIGGVNDIFTMDAAGTPASYRRLTQNQGQNESPAWAPNSRHLTFSSNRSGQWQVYIMLDDGSNQRALTTTGRNTQPDWSPQPR